MKKRYFKKPCKKCNKMFEPYGNYYYYCKECNKISFKIGYKEMMKKIHNPRKHQLMIKILMRNGFDLREIIPDDELD